MKLFVNRVEEREGKRAGEKVIVRERVRERQREREAIELPTSFFATKRNTAVREREQIHIKKESRGTIQRIFLQLQLAGANLQL